MLVDYCARLSIDSHLCSPGVSVHTLVRKLFFQSVKDMLVSLKDNHGRMNICWANERIDDTG